MANEQQQVTMSIPYPDPRVFGQVPKQGPLGVAGNLSAYEFDRAEYPPEGGILTYKKGLLFPTKGFVFPQAIQCINVAKKMFINGVMLLASKTFIWFAVGLLFTSYKNKVKLLNKILFWYNQSMYLVVKPISPERNFHIDVAKGVWHITETFLSELGADKQEVGAFSMIMATIINYDNAYHLRLIDVFSEMKREDLIANPAKEIKRVLAIYEKRELASQVVGKFKAVYWILRLAFLSPKVLKAFRTAVGSVNWKQLCYDDIDWYNVLERGDYLFGGKTYEERYQIFLAMHKGSPPQQIALVQ